MDKLKVNREYEFYCGQDIAFDYIADYISERIGDKDIKDSNILVVSDRNVGGYFYSRFEQQYLEKGVRPELTIVDARDNYKNLSSVTEVIKSLVDFDFGKGDWVISLGGGGVLDVTSFACRLYSADINLICIPTTLNSMAESSLSGESYINSGSHKNVLSVDSVIKAVFIDPSFLKTVPQKVATNGYSAIIRYAVLADPTLLKELLDTSDLRVFLERVYETRSKVEKMNPALLTLGAELAVAIEGYFRFMNYSEGEALAISLYSAVPVKYRQALDVLYNKLGLPNRLTGVSGNMILKVLEDGLVRKYNKELFDIVDLKPGDNTWIVRSVTVDEAMEILKKRTGVICEG
ncbi:MAG: iron-containing alcohol dehydrogenase [Clostridiales bacterium]|nr:iron-containing alcohol dehydrogenase [Clostridiales bacterium]